MSLSVFNLEKVEKIYYIFPVGNIMIREYKTPVKLIIWNNFLNSQNNGTYMYYDTFEIYI